MGASNCNSNYDKISLKDTPYIIPQDIDFQFAQSLKIERDYDDSLCEKVIEHGRQGYFFESFSGRYNICQEALISWLNDKENPNFEDFRSAVKISMSACLHYWNCKLNCALDNFNNLGGSVPVLKSMISDIMKGMPKGLRAFQFENLEAPDTPEEIKYRRMLKDKEEEYNIYMGKSEI
jgi:hypothetical protein